MKFYGNRPSQLGIILAARPNVNFLGRELIFKIPFVISFWKSIDPVRGNRRP